VEAYTIYFFFIFIYIHECWHFLDGNLKYIKKQRECAPIQEIDMAGDEQSAVILKFGTISRQL
jgi:hypothetical protein